ncbi:hypothetical protein FKM82_015468 [Ascaphus truei]
MPTEASGSLVQALAQLLRDYGDAVLDGTRVLSLLTPCLQVVTRLFEQLFPRGPGMGFQALPAHPADSVPILRTQLLLDMLQKTPALKLIHPAGSPRQFDVNIFPFKSLRRLELRALPPHCLRGLRTVYSQLEVLICSKCISSLEEVISLCGGDLSSALPWLELHTLNFSYNMISNLDKSLELLNVLKILDLSHNRIRDCGSYLKAVAELQYLNLGYNLLLAVPELSTGSRTQLHSLILRHNQLTSTNGLEQLSNLQHLDLSYNLLLEHNQLTGLSRLHRLKKLFLEGNPLYFHTEHRTLTAQHVSAKASGKILLDGTLLSCLDITTPPAPGERGTPQPYSSANESSCTGDLTDSYSAADSTATRLPRKKSKVKVRRASITERSDSECEQRGQPIGPVLQHQGDIDRIDSFRDQFGIDWLQYRPHLEGELSQDLPARNSPSPARRSPSPGRCTPPPAVVNTDLPRSSPPPAPDSPSAGLTTSLSPKSSAAVDEPAAVAQAMENADDVLDDPLWEQQETRQQEEETVDDALCSPVAVCPVLDGRPRDPDWPWVFLRVTCQFLLEMDLQDGRVLLRRELRSLQDIQTSVILWNWNGEEQELPTLSLSFDSVCEEKQCVCYVVLDNTPQISVQTLLQVLRPMLERNRKSDPSAEALRLQCLKCRAEYSQQDVGSIICSTDTTQQSGDGSPSTWHNTATGNAACPSCGSCHIVLAPLLQNGDSSTPLPCAPPRGGEEGVKYFYLGEEEEEDSSGTGSSSITAPADTESTVFYSFDTEGPSIQGLQPPPDTNGDSLTGSYRYGTPGSPTPPQTPSGFLPEGRWQISPSVSPDRTEDFRLVDHRLKLFLDMEILGGEAEEFRCYMKVPVVRFGKAGEFWALVVVSNHEMYFLEITGDTRGPPCDWLQPGDTQSLTSLSHLHMGLQQQSLHLGFDGYGAAYTLLTRNRHSCANFSKSLLETLSELPPRYHSNLVYSPEESVTAQHRLWPLVSDVLGAKNKSSPEFLYLLAFFLREDVIKAREPACANSDSNVTPCNTASNAALSQGAARASPVSLLLTRTHMYLLEETHQWLHSRPAATNDCPEAAGDAVQMMEKQPISNISSVHLFRSAACHLRIQLYNETQQSESAWLLWTEDSELPAEIVEWLRVPWEAEYDIHFNQIIHDTVE